MTETNLATEKQLVKDLRAELQRVKEAAQLAKEVVEAEKQASYQLVVEETQVRLAEELSVVCRDYCNVSWNKALDVAGVPVDSEWRQPRHRNYHPEIRKIPGSPHPSLAYAPETSE